MTDEADAEERAEAEGSPPRPRRRRRRSWAPSFWGPVLLAAGVGMATAITDREARIELVGGNLPVNPADPLDNSARNSPSLVANPRNEAVLALASRVVAAPRASCSLYVSSDGGASWAERGIPLPKPEASLNCLAPEAAFGSDGALYVAFSTFGPVEGHGSAPDGVWVVRSHDEGRTFSTPVRAAGPLAFHPTVVADLAAPGVLWVAWLQATETRGFGLGDTPAPIVVARSGDGGSTWSTPARATSPLRKRVIAPVLEVVRPGRLLLAFVDVGDDVLDYAGAHEGRAGDPYPGRWTLLVAGSHDGGKSWQESIVERRAVPARRFVMLQPPRPSLAVDSRRGNVYLAFEEGRDGNADVWVWRSEDGGRHWSDGKAVAEVASDSTSQQLGTVAVAPNGRVDVLYYDRRGDPADVLTGASLRSSFDRARSFTRPVELSTVRFDSNIGPAAEGAVPDLGDRLGLVSANKGVLAVWADTRAGLPTTDKQDLARAVAAIQPPVHRQTPARWGGLALAASGVAVVTRGLRRRRRGTASVPSSA